MFSRIYSNDRRESRMRECNLQASQPILHRHTYVALMTISLSDKYYHKTNAKVKRLMRLFTGKASLRKARARETTKVVRVEGCE